ncbi:hypothetical protein [Micromonospora craterilacus]|uniref:hypothetical protein n=1 Tax=Micromonospora craterilacus TaxID=1655439 RepID=UPI0011B5B452|nr:hypothetical protein [Micromonospora craterilacus]
MTVPLASFALLGCWFGLVSVMPSEPCPGDPADWERWWLPIAILLCALMILTAVLSIAVAWLGVSNPRRSAWPFLVVSLLGLAFSASLMILIDRVTSC